MDVEPFELERWFAEYEHDADVMLAESGVRSLPADRFDTDPGDLGYVIPTAGAPDVREAIAAEYGRSAEEVVCTVGTQEANFLAFQSLLSPGDHAVVVTPTYQSLHAVPDSICDVTRVPLDEPDWALDVDAVADAIRPETELVVVNNPNNPTGRRHPEEAIRALYDLAADADAYLLCDEVYRLLAEDPVPPVASLGERGISTASLSKAYGLAGLRFGWLAGPAEVVEAAERWKDYTTISPSKFGQHVARQVLDGEEGALRSDALDHVRENREITAEWARRHGLDWPDPVGCNVFLRVPDGFSGSREFCRTVVEDAGVVLAPGDCFSTGGESYDGYFRLGFGLPTDELWDGLARVDTVL
ncbi:aminotransferase class I/II-fold pyridoxal phosphate-dependent enzyme [Halobacterium sp. R2-5]|uniref:aminotransferase class I/II-fold pyridoxal phosphate-dependent enzyme n=1 Tax=Halobacterium sp. R2-5 TaxID=2715751 RepID=UPI00141F7EBC|nr:aminotransferase class I/II-fold pyridoxal phosphate-dependent enzyme [Halobacterium sp. R2-5]NIC00023.1 aminotransferase class I/II-fold pyridoxal phosphate-dependent enzyme [Halobacterium sp. R2-5]